MSANGSITFPGLSGEKVGIDFVKLPVLQLHLDSDRFGDIGGNGQTVVHRASGTWRNLVIV